jgi:hypothetical protein
VILGWRMVLLIGITRRLLRPGGVLEVILEFVYFSLSGIPSRHNPACSRRLRQTRTVTKGQLIAR